MALLEQKSIQVSQTITIGIAKTLEEKREIYRLRYRIYANEVMYKLVTADHVNQLIYDELDRWGTIFYARVNGKLAGTIRVNVGEIKKFPAELVETVLMNRFMKYYHNRNHHSFGLMTKLMLSSEFRGLHITTYLMSKAFGIYCDNKVDFGFLNSNFCLVPLYEYYGHRRFGQNVTDIDFGFGTSFVIMPEDIEHLKNVQSPFYDIAIRKGKTQNNSVVEWYQAEFPEAAAILNTQLATEEQFWRALQEVVQDSPLKVIPLLQGLTEKEARIFVHACGIIDRCHQGQWLTTPRDSCQELIILLAGKLSSGTPVGHSFGSNGLLIRTTHKISIQALTDVTFLVLSHHSFQYFLQSFSSIAQKIFYNLLKTVMALPPA